MFSARQTWQAEVSVIRQRPHGSLASTAGEAFGFSPAAVVEVLVTRSWIHGYEAADDGSRIELLKSS